MLDVVGAGAAAAEDLRAQAGLLHRLEHLDVGLEVRQRPRLPLREPGGVLHAAVVGQHPPERQVRQRVHQLRQGDRIASRRDAAAGAHGHVDDDVSGDTGVARRGRQVARVRFGVHRLHEVSGLLAQLHGAPDLGRREIGRRHHDPVHALRHERLGFTQLGGAHADGAGGELHLGDVGALVGLGVRPRRDAKLLHRRLQRANVALESIRDPRRAPAYRGPTWTCRRRRQPRRAGRQPRRPSSP